MATIASQVEPVCYDVEFVKSQANGGLSYEKVTLISGENLIAGTVLGKITASGKYTQFDDTAATGEEDAAAILAYDTDASGGDKPCTIIARQAEVNASLLTWPATADAGEKTAALAQLAALGIIAR